MRGKILLAVSVFFAGLALVSLVFANPPAAARARHADRNKDGVVDRKEVKMERRWEHKQHMKTVDKNADGVIQPAEKKLEASRVNTPWEKRADTNSDGRVSADEFSAWKAQAKERIDLNDDGTIDAKERRLSWRHSKARVNKPLEAKYDANGDGWLQPEEVKQMLKAKHELIKTRGKAKVDTDIEKEYDANNDGILDAEEAASMAEDLK